MLDSVKYIFKTLIKVPIIILVSYFIFNIFAFTFTYFKLMGFSYVVLQTAVENNYIPPSEKTTLTNYAASLETEILENVQVGCDTNKYNGDPHLNILAADSDNNKVQYGTEMTVTVSAHYRFVWPLMPKEQVDGGNAVAGFTGMTTGTALSEAELEAARQAYEDNPNNNITISYTVPGLKYYPDLSN